LANPGTLLGETFEGFLVGVGEGGGRGRKNFEDSSELSVLVVTVKDRHDEDGADTEAAGDGRIDAWVEFGIDGKLGLTGLKTGAGKTVAGVEGNAEIGGEVSGGGAADHFIAASESQSGGAGESRFGGADYEFVED
jgi:hypothetical protein